MSQRKHIFQKGLVLCLILSLFCGNLAMEQKVSASSGLKKPTFSVTNRTKKTVTLKVKKNGTVTGYHVYLRKGKKGKWSLTTLALRTHTIKLTKLKATQTYYVKIRSYRTRGLSIRKSKFSKVKKISPYTTPETVTPAPSPSANPTNAPSGTGDDTAHPDELLSEVLYYVNKEREKEGLPAYTLDTTLQEAAGIRANELTTVFDHVRPDGTDCFTVLNELNYFYQAVGENIAAGQETAREVVDSWMNSSGHRANIMSQKFTKMGVGYCHTESGYKNYWVQLFSD